MQNAIYLLFVLLALPPFAAPSRAGETPETLLIRQALANDISGYRRADTELALKAYHPHFVAYQGHANGDPRAWTVLHENRDAFESQLAKDLSAQRYEVTRTVPFIAVRTTHAIATSVDSGRVVDRQTSEPTPVVVHRFWTFLKEEDDWLATGMVADLGDTLLPAAGAPANGEIAELLQRESQAWEAGSGILGFFDANFTGYEALGSLQAGLLQNRLQRQRGTGEVARQAAALRAVRPRPQSAPHGHRPWRRRSLGRHARKSGRRARQRTGQTPQGTLRVLDAEPPLRLVESHQHGLRLGAGTFRLTHGKTGLATALYRRLLVVLRLLGYQRCPPR